MKLMTLACSAALLVCSSAALAQTATSPSGRQLASGCFQCHDSGGIGGFERLAGRDADDTVRELQRLRLADEREAGQNIIVRKFGGRQPDAQPTTHSACYSTITADQPAWLTVVFQYDPLTRTMVPAADSSAASVGWSEKNWFRYLMADPFA